MKKLLSILFIASISLTACQKDDPIAETDQEEVGTATLTFTEVEREAHGDHYHYNDIAGADVETVRFAPTSGQLLPEVGSHLHLEVGKTYRLELKATDFAGRETQQTFVTRHDIHQAFLLGTPQGALDYVYADRDENDQRVNVGVTGYLTVLDHADTFVLQYIIRHLNPGVKEKITASDWNNSNYQQFAGETDLDLKVEVHLVDEHNHADH